MSNCPLTGQPCGHDKLFQITESVREFRYSTDCCRNCAADYIRLRNDSAGAEAEQMAQMDAAIAPVQPSQPAPAANNVQDLLSQLLGVDVTLFNKPIIIEKIGTVKPKQETPAKRCPKCECTIQDLRKMKKMGCPQCYETFADELDKYLPRIQGGKKSHTGKVPMPQDDATPVLDVKLPPNSEDLVKILKEQMAIAISEEDYEKAAQCRDLIKKYGGEPSE